MKIAATRCPHVTFSFGQNHLCGSSASCRIGFTESRSPLSKRRFHVVSEARVRDRTPAKRTHHLLSVYGIALRENTSPKSPETIALQRETVSVTQRCQPAPNGAALAAPRRPKAVLAQARPGPGERRGTLYEERRRFSLNLPQEWETGVIKWSPRQQQV